MIVDPCRCVWCGGCSGSGRVEVPTNGYPEWELESCTECGGTGVSEQCAHCDLLEELEEARV